MTETQLNLGNELFDKLSKLKKEREKYFNIFEHFSEQKNQEEVSVKLKISEEFEDCFVSTFPRLEILKLYEKRIIIIDIKIKGYEDKFKQL